MNAVAVTSVAIVSKSDIDPTGLIYQELLQQRGIAVQWVSEEEAVGALSGSKLDSASVLRSVDAVIDVIPLIGDLGNDFANAVEDAGVVLYNSAQACEIAGDKWLSYEYAVKAGVPVPLSVLIHDEETLVVEADRLGYPVVLKDPGSMQGNGVLLAHTVEELTDAADQLGLATKALMLQHYIECGARDKRIVVVDGVVVDCHERVSTSDPFRSNVSLGGKAARVAVEADEEHVAITIAEALGMDVAGMDISRVTKVLPGREYLPVGTPFWIEANENPGFRPGDLAPPFVIDLMLRKVDARRDLKAVSVPKAV